MTQPPAFEATRVKPPLVTRRYPASAPSRRLALRAIPIIDFAQPLSASVIEQLTPMKERIR